MAKETSDRTTPRGRVWQARRRGDLDYVLAALTDTNAGVRDIAATSLGKMRDRRAVEPLLRRLRSGDDGHSILDFLGSRPRHQPRRRAYAWSRSWHS